MFQPNAVMVPRDLVRDFLNGSISDHDFCNQIRVTFDRKKKARPVANPLQPAASDQAVVVTAEDLPDAERHTHYEWVNAYLTEVFGDRDHRFTYPAFDKIFDAAGGDLDLISDTIDYADWWRANKAPIQTVVGFLVHQLTKTHPDKIRDYAARQRESRTSDPKTITRIAMQKTEEAVRNAVAGPDAEKIRRLQEEVQRRRGINPDQRVADTPSEDSELAEQSD